MRENNETLLLTKRNTTTTRELQVVRSVDYRKGERSRGPVDEVVCVNWSRGFQEEHPLALGPHERSLGKVALRAFEFLEDS